ncbi:MAG: DUF485 domain-containing protein [Armatimonadota bacterium]
MLHKPSAPVGKDNASSFKTRLGVWMLLFYSMFYVGFVAINLYNPLLMEKVIAFNLNLATVYGFALIIVALVQAMIYDMLCRKQEKIMNNESEEGRSK